MSEHDSAPPDETLVERIRVTPTDDLRDFDLLVRRHQGHVMANCRYLTRSPEHAEDLAQEVFLKAYFGLRRFEQRSSFRTWLHRIKVHHCFDFMKRRRPPVVNIEDPNLAAEPELAVPPVAEQELLRAIERQRVARVLDSMPDKLRIPLLLRDLDGLSYQAVAETLGISLPAVKMRIMRARQAFRRRFGPHGDALHSERDEQEIAT